MAREIRLEAYFRHPGEVGYSTNWIWGFLDSEPPLEGRLIIGLSNAAVVRLYDSIKEYRDKGESIFITGDDDIFAEPEILQGIILAHWEEWKEEDKAVIWSAQTIREFFRQYHNSVMIVHVY